MTPAGPFRRHVPNLLTESRIAAGPVIAVLYTYVENGAILLLAVAAIFVAGAITDLLDGRLARRWNCTSKLGAFLDPFADKSLSWAALYVFWGEFPGAREFLILAYVPIVGYDVLTTAARIAQWAKLPIELTTSETAKQRTVVIQVAFSVLLPLLAACGAIAPYALADFGLAVLATAAFIAIVFWTARSGYEYATNGFRWGVSPT